MHPATLPDYGALFRRQVARALGVTLDTLAASPDGAATDVTARALEVLRFALPDPAHWGLVRDVLARLDPRMDREGRAQEWLLTLYAGIAVAEAYADLAALADLWMWTGVAHRTLGNYPEARHWLERSHAAALELDDPLRRACASNRLAWTERLAGNRSQALAWTEQALAVLEPATPEAQLEQARSYAILGAIAVDDSRNADAEHYFRQVLAVEALRREPLRYAWAHADLGLALSVQERPAEALPCYTAALAVLEQVYAPVVTAVMQLNLSGIHLRLENAHAALTFCQDAYPPLERINDVRRLAMLDTNRGIAYRQLRQYDVAQAALESALQRAHALENPNLIINAYHELVLMFLEMRDDAAARDALAAAYAQLASMAQSPRKEYWQERLRATSLQSATLLTPDAYP